MSDDQFLPFEDEPRRRSPRRRVKDSSHRRVRRTDPDTSQAAAKKSEATITENCKRVVSVFVNHGVIVRRDDGAFYTLTDIEGQDWYVKEYGDQYAAGRVPECTFRKRRFDLPDKYGVPVIDMHTRRNGAIVWGLKQ